MQVSEFFEDGRLSDATEQSTERSEIPLITFGVIMLPHLEWDVTRENRAVGECHLDEAGGGAVGDSGGDGGAGLVDFEGPGGRAVEGEGGGSGEVCAEDGDLAALLAVRGQGAHEWRQAK